MNVLTKFLPHIFMITLLCCHLFINMIPGWHIWVAFSQIVEVRCNMVYDLSDTQVRNPGMNFLSSSSNAPQSYVFASN